MYGFRCVGGRQQLVNCDATDATARPVDYMTHGVHRPRTARRHIPPPRGVEVSRDFTTRIINLWQLARWWRPPPVAGSTIIRIVFVLLFREYIWTLNVEQQRAVFFVRVCLLVHIRADDVDRRLILFNVISLGEISYNPRVWVYKLNVWFAHGYHLKCVGLKCGRCLNCGYIEWNPDFYWVLFHVFG